MKDEEAMREQQLGESSKPVAEEKLSKARSHSRTSDHR